MNDLDRTACRRYSWYVGIGAGALVAAMLLFVAGRGWGQSLLIGVIVAVLLALFLVWAFCSAKLESADVPAEPARPEPVPAAEPAMPASEPAAPAQSEPAATDAARSAPPQAAALAEPAPKPQAAAAVKPKAAAKPRAAKAAASKPKAATRKSAPAADAEAPKAHTGSALDAALAKSREPASKAGPELLTRPRGGKSDDLKQIRGVGPKLEKLLNDVGVWHFDQIASWKARDIAFVDEKMEGFKGRITRDEWVKQAKVLAAGGTTEFSERVAKGDVY